MRIALRMWAVFLAVLVVVSVPTMVVVWLAGRTGALVLLGVIAVAFFAWLTVICVQDEQARREYWEWREKHRDRSYP
jgi:Na+/melibiose symporter-like transporter